MNPDYYFTAVALIAIVAYILWRTDSNNNDPRSS
jgi:hypothetical protein